MEETVNKIDSGNAPCLRRHWVLGTKVCRGGAGALEEDTGRSDSGGRPREDHRDVSFGVRWGPLRGLRGSLVRQDGGFSSVNLTL